MMTEEQKVKNNRWAVAVLFVLLPAVTWFAGIGTIYVLLPALAACACRGSGISWAALGLTRQKMGRQLLWGIGLSVALLAVFVGLPLLVAPLQHWLAPAAPTALALTWNLGFLFLVVGPMEEFLYRGYFQEALGRMTGSPLWGVLLSALLFGGSHWLSNFSAVQLCFTTAIGGFLAVCKWKLPHCSLLSVALAHSLYNVFLELLRWFFC